MMAENNSNGAAAPGSEAPSGGEAPGGTIKDFLDFDPFEPSQGKATEPSDGTGGEAPSEPTPAGAGDALPPESPQPVKATPASGDEAVLRELARINDTLAASQQQRGYTAPARPSGP